jgi:hypothetical protein
MDNIIKQIQENDYDYHVYICDLKTRSFVLDDFVLDGETYRDILATIKYEIIKLAPDVYVLKSYDGFNMPIISATKTLIEIIQVVKQIETIDRKTVIDHTFIKYWPLTAFAGINITKLEGKKIDCVYRINGRSI